MSSYWDGKFYVFLLLILLSFKHMLLFSISLVSASMHRYLNFEQITPPMNHLPTHWMCWSMVLQSTLPYSDYRHRLFPHHITSYKPHKKLPLHRQSGHYLFKIYQQENPSMFLWMNGSQDFSKPLIRRGVNMIRLWVIL